MINVCFLLFIVFIIIFVISWTFIHFFQNKNKKLNNKLFKLVGNSGTAITDISDLFGIVSFKDDFGYDKNIACYSYREKINKGFRVLITDYNSEKEMFVVDEYPK